MASIFKMCGKYLIKNKYSVICYGVLCLTSSMFSMISPYISGNFIDYLIVADNISKIYRYCFAFFGLFVFNQLIGYIVNRVYIKMQTQMGYDLNSDVIRHIQHLPVSFLKKQNMAYLNQRVNNDSNQVITFCINIVQGILINSLKLLLSIFVLVQFSCNITLLFIAIICAYALSYKILKKILFKAQFILTEAQANYFSKLFEQFDNILFVKMQAIYEAFLSRLKKEFQNILKVSLQYQKISYLFSSLDSLIMSLAQIGIFIMGGALVIRGKLSVGQLTIMLSYFGIMMEASRYFFSLTKTIQDKCSLGKVTISTVLGYKEYVAENIKSILGEDEENSDFRIYPDYHKIYRGQTEIVLTKAEYELFMLLSGRPGVIFTKEKIFEILYNEELPESIDNIVYCLVSSMRKKIEPELKQCRYIKTVRGVGYKFEGKKMDIFPE